MDESQREALAAKKVAELQNMAVELGVPGKGLRKAQLIDAILGSRSLNGAMPPGASPPSSTPASAATAPAPAPAPAQPTPAEPLSNNGLVDTRGPQPTPKTSPAVPEASSASPPEPRREAPPRH